jgi:hypothetical protein
MFRLLFFVICAGLFLATLPSPLAEGLVLVLFGLLLGTTLRLPEVRQ